MEISILSKFWYWYLLFSIIAIAAGIYSYRRSYPPLSKTWRVSLALLRGIAVLLLGILLLEPLINIHSDRITRSRLAVLVDDTSSMGVSSEGQPRIQLADSLASGALSEMGGNYDIYTFSGGKVAAKKLPGINDLSGDATSISNAIRSVESQKNFNDYGAMLLVTDGRQNLGEDPVDAAAKLGIPVYTITVGKETPEADLSINNLSFPAMAYSGDRMKIAAEISARGLDGEKTRIFLKNGNKTIATKPLDIPSAGRSVTVEFEAEAPEPGNVEYSISAPVLKGETKSADNERIFIVRVLKSKIRVFLGTSALNWEFKFIKQAINNFDEFQLDAVYPEFSGRFASPGTPKGHEGLSQYDVLIFADCSPDNLRIQLPDLRGFLADGGSLIYVAGDNFRSDLRRYDAFLPLEPGNISSIEGEFTIEPVHKNRQHAAIVLDEDPDQSDKLWNSLTPLSDLITGLKPTGEVLLEASAVGPSGLSYPVLTVGNFEKGHVAAITGFPLWRSYFGSVNDPRLAGLIPRFWRNLLRWASSTEESQKFKVLTDQRVYRLGEQVGFTAYLNDESNAPRSGALVTVSVRPHGETVKIKDVLLPQVDPGIYKGQLDTPGAGKFDYEAVATSHGDSLGHYSGEFMVESFSLEMASSAPDYGLTRRISEVTGGRAYNAGDFSGFSNDLDLKPRVEPELSQFRIFRMPFLLAIVLIALCAEWAFRKRLRLP